MTSVGSVLYSERGKVVRRLEKSIASSGGAIQRLGLRLSLSDEELARAVAQALQTPVGDFAAEAWSQFDEVLDACRRTDGRRGARELVRLLGHTVHTTQAIDVDVDNGGQRQTILTLTLRVDVSVNAVTIVVEAGRVAAIRPGAASASASLWLGDVQVAPGSAPDVALGLGSGPRRRAA